MPPILFLTAKNKENYRVFSRMGFPVNYHIRYSDRDVITGSVMLSSNRISIEIPQLNHEATEWIGRFCSRARYHGVEAYIITPEKLDVPEARIIPLIVSEGTLPKQEIIAMKYGSMRSVKNKKLFVLTEREPWSQEALELLNSEYVWAISAYVDELIEKDKVLCYDISSKTFEFVDLEEFKTKHLGEVLEYLQKTCGIKSLMLNEFYRFCYEANSEFEEDVIDAIIGFSIINLYIAYDL